MRLRTLATILFYFICTSFLLGQISISKDNSTANPSAILDVKSTEKGLLLPRMTADEIKLIAEPANGLLVYNLDDEKFYAFREGVGKWIQLADGSGELVPELICEDSFVDARDGTTYNVVKIGNQCWMKENLNIGTKIDSPLNPSDNMLIEKYCYDNLESNCDIFGGLYNFQEMIQYSSIEGSQGVCPEGWHLPTDNDLCTLASIIDPNAFICGGGGANNTVGGKMKQTGFETWNMPNQGANNSSGFTALAGGAYEGSSFEGLRQRANFWSSGTPPTNLDSPIYELVFSDDNYVRKLSNKNWSYSVRCVKDTGQ